MVRVLLRVADVCIRMRRRVNLRDQFDPACIRHIFQFAVVVFCVDRISVHIVEIVESLSGIYTVICQTGKGITFQPVHAVPYASAGKAFRTVLEIVIQMKLELIHLIPCKDFCIILQILKTMGNPSHVKHDSTDLIVRIVPDHSTRNIVISLILPEDLLNGDRSIKTSGICTAVDADPPVIHCHEISFVPDIISVRTL